MPKFRAALFLTNSSASSRLGPERENKTTAELDLECLKENYPVYTHETILTPAGPFYNGETDEIFTNGTC